MIRRAINEDIPGIMKLLVQVDMVHHNGRPDIFKGPATKYDEEQLKEIIKDDTKPIFVYAPIRTLRQRTQSGRYILFPN